MSLEVEFRSLGNFCSAFKVGASFKVGDLTSLTTGDFCSPLVKGSFCCPFKSGDLGSPFTMGDLWSPPKEGSFIWFPEGDFRFLFDTSFK